ncbi:M16 family peptidase [Candidatus Trichorickettsia mobilis]|uniref:M16 family peptidase n=1 Tax=Candidatus Trichorickettsia mobilis TaxID=1346319 RepID=A0ABZ0UTT0_9RICK|nr:pitrilysin family protein [Candidatus Trichorickettsia mobilis]WPY00492.1 M16 family peptidase [Candidatus Trichorickettsia mobilis]
MTFNVSKLANGLTVVTYRMPAVQSVAINLIVKVGGRYETIETSGISHFLEHMAFKGTSTRSAKKIAENFDAIGGHFNAYTSREHTVYHAKVLHDDCFQALEILADIMQNSLFAEEDIIKERQVILQEIAQVYDDPDDLAQEVFYNLAYHNQPLGRSILGEEHILNSFNHQSFKDYLRKHYNANNIYLSVAGQVTHENIMKSAELLFSGLHSGQDNSYVSAEYTSGYHFTTKELEQTTVILGFENTSYLNLPALYHSQLLSLVFGGGVSSKLFQQIRENLGLAYSVGTYISAYHDSGLFSIYAATSHDKVAFLISSLAEEIKKITDNIRLEDLNRAKAQIKASIYISEESSSRKSEEVGKYYAIFGRYLSVEEIMEHIMTANIEDIKNVAINIFAAKPTLSIVGNCLAESIAYEELCQDLKRHSC